MSQLDLTRNYVRQLQRMVQQAKEPVAFVPGFAEFLRAGIAAAPDNAFAKELKAALDPEVE